MAIGSVAHHGFVPPGLVETAEGIQNHAGKTPGAGRANQGPPDHAVANGYRRNHAAPAEHDGDVLDITTEPDDVPDDDATSAGETGDGALDPTAGDDATTTGETGDGVSDTAAEHEVTIIEDINAVLETGEVTDDPLPPTVEDAADAEITVEIDYLSTTLADNTTLPSDPVFELLGQWIDTVG